MRRAAARQLHAARSHLVGRELGQDVGRQQGGQVGALGLHDHWVVGGHAAFPAMGDKVVGHRADGVGRAAEQVDAVVAIEVHGPLHPAAGHELAHAHGARVAAAQRERVRSGAVREAQELLQLAAEVLGACLRAGVGCGEVEAQRGQGVDHAEIAHLLAVDGLHADDADDDFGRHAVLLFGTRQRGGIGLPEACSGAYAHGLDKAAAVDAPVLGRALGSRRHQAGHLGQKARLGDGVAHPVHRQVVAHRNVGSHLHGVRPFAVGRAALHGLGHGGAACRRGGGSSGRALFRGRFGRGLGGSLGCAGLGGRRLAGQRAAGQGGGRKQQQGGGDQSLLGHGVLVVGPAAAACGRGCGLRGQSSARHWRRRAGRPGVSGAAWGADRGARA